ncbi:MAG: hypothetical protein KDH88_20245 [Chromatiales bacterium]|nr:hypothetical protein [Chromatiales bacterium]
MDDKEFKKTLNKVNALPCVFEKAILALHGRCSFAVRRYIGEREAVGCGSEAAQNLCLAWLSLLRDKAAFALGESHSSGKLAHAKAMKLQVGGLRGLNALINEDQGPVEDIHALIHAAHKEYQGLEQVPYSRLMPVIQSFQGRQKRRRQED